MINKELEIGGIPSCKVLAVGDKVVFHNKRGTIMVIALDPPNYRVDFGPLDFKWLNKKEIKHYDYLREKLDIILKQESPERSILE